MTFRAIGTRARRAAVALAVTASAAWPGALTAQEPHRVEVGAALTVIDHRREHPGGVDTSLHGIAWSLRSRFRVEWLELGLEYGEGTLSAAEPANSSALVFANAMIGLRVAPWLLLEVGPRAYQMDAPVERRVTSFSAGGTLAFDLVPGLARGHTHVGTDLAGNAGAAGDISGGPIAEVGISLTPPLPIPIRLDATYRIERDGFPSPDGGSERWERLVLSVGTRF